MSVTKVYGLAAAFVNFGRMFGSYGTQKRSAVGRSRTVHGYAPEICRLFFVACLNYAAEKSSTVRGCRAYGFAIFPLRFSSIPRRMFGHIRWRKVEVR